ncbi:olfactory receptor 14A2-like [Phascolarctos cinereus]
MGFSNIWELQVLHAMFFLLIYVMALIGNLLIFTLITLDGHFNTPMYFFLKNLSFLDVCLISVTVLKSIENSLSRSCSISFFGCVLQVLLVILLAGSEIFLLTVMSYDCYVAICQPLHYDEQKILNENGNFFLAHWRIFFRPMSSVSTFSLPFCSPKEIHQFFCDVPSLLRISCAETHNADDVNMAIWINLGVFCCISTAISYGHIFSTVLNIPTTEGHSKAFSTCLPHLIVLMVFIMTVAISYINPTLASESVLTLLLSMFYSVVPPTLNPIIYSLRE